MRTLPAACGATRLTNNRVSTPVETLQSRLSCGARRCRRRGCGGGLTREDYRRAADLVHTYRDLPLGTTDATVIAVCERLALTEIASLDHRHLTVAR